MNPTGAGSRTPATHELARSLGYQGDHERFSAEWDAATAALESATAGSLVEFSMTDAAVAFARHAGVPITDIDAVALGASYLREWRRHVCPVAGAPEMVMRLARSHRIGVVSNTHDPDMVPSMLAAMGLADSMSIVVLSVEHGVRKPHPSIYARCVDELGVEPAEVLFVGDSYAPDYEAPRRAGMHARLICTDADSRVIARHRLRTVTDTEAAGRMSRFDLVIVDCAGVPAGLPSHLVHQSGC